MEHLDYKNFRLSDINKAEYRHLKYLIFWPVYLFSFFFLERIWVRDNYHVVHCPLDDRIPFCEYFLIPYFLWFAELILIQAYTLLYDTESFKKFIRMLSIGFMGTLFFYVIYPTCQNLRVPGFTRSNIFTRVVKWLYKFDTNTNVCPSLHVVGAMAVVFCAWHAKGLDKPIWRLTVSALNILISLSTVFLKQHSVIDLLTAVPVAVAAYLYVYRKKPNAEAA